MARLARAALTCGEFKFDLVPARKDVGARLRSLDLDGGPRGVKHCGSEKRIWKLGVGAAHNIHDSLQREGFSACVRGQDWR